MATKKQQGTGLLSELKTAGAAGTPADRLIEDVVKANKIHRSERTRYREKYDRDPVGTQQLLAKLAPGPAATGNPRPKGTGLV